MALVIQYRVKNWRDFQHYKHRDPPWIKLHYRLLSSRDWVTLDDASRVLAIACMLIASRNQGLVDGDPEYIQRVAYLKKPPDFKPLIRCGFLEVASECKQMLADASVVLTNRVSETETETEKEALASKRSSRRVPEDFEPDREHAIRVIPDLDVDVEIQKFRDWEFKRARSDWSATWRNWIQTCKESGRYARKEKTKWL